MYRTNRADQVSWYQSDPKLSLELIRQVAPDRTARIVDIGAGASRLVDALAAQGYEHVTVLDLSSSALAEARARVGATTAVTWIEGDVLTTALAPGSFDVWHDRAVFHFLTDAGDRATYIAQVCRAVRSGGHVVVATFAADGPTKCSGLPVARYSADALVAEFGDSFRLVRAQREVHVTPSGATQPFTYCLFQIISAHADAANGR